MTICPTEGCPSHSQEKYLDTMLETMLVNNHLTNTSQTVIPVGLSGSGKTWSCQVMLRTLLSKLGHAQDTDMLKHLVAATEVIRPMVEAAVPGSKDSSRMVRTCQICFLLL